MPHFLIAYFCTGVVVALIWLCLESRAYQQDYDFGEKEKSLVLLVAYFVVLWPIILPVVLVMLLEHVLQRKVYGKEKEHD